MTYAHPRHLRRDDDVSEFVCGSQEQTEWLLRHAKQAHSSGTSKVFVVTEADSNVVVAYYGWCMSAVAVAQAPERLLKGAGRYPQPIALLARLGVHQDHEGRGLGSALLRDVLERVAGLSEDIGCRGLIVHAETQGAKNFYQRRIEFEEMPDNPLHLVLVTKDIRRYLNS